MRNTLDVSSQLILKSECSKPRRVPISTVITSDQKHVCIAIDDQIFLYDIRSGQRISVINQTDTVIALSSSSDNQLLVYLMNGLLIEYAMPSQAVVQYKQLNIQQKLLKIYQSPTTSNQIYAIIGDCYDTDEYFKNLNIIRIHTSADSTSIENVIKDERKFNISPKLTNLERLALSDKLCVGCVDNRVLVYAYESGKSVKYEYNSSKEELNKGLVNDFVSIKLYQKPEEEASKLIGVLHFGRILLWNIEMANKGSVRIVLMQSVHWHRGAPSVCLTSEQSLLSAGIEGVLVKYSSAVSNKSSLCSFLSRLGAPVTSLYLSPYPSSYLITHLLDNTIQVISTKTFTVQTQLQTLQHSYQSHVPSSNLTVDPLYPHLVIDSAKPGYIQWINPIKMITLTTLDVVQHQNQPEILSLQPFRIAQHWDCSAIAVNDRYIITAIKQFNTNNDNDTDSNRLSILKFWRRDQQTSSSHLSAHQCALEFIAQYEAEINLLRCSTVHQDFCIGIDVHGKIIKWKRFADNNININENIISWIPTANVNYKRLSVANASQINYLSRFATIHHHCDKNNNDNDKEMGSTLIVWSIATEGIKELSRYDSCVKLNSAQWYSTVHKNDANVNDNNNLLIICSSSNEVFAFDTSQLTFTWSVLNDGNLTIGLYSSDKTADNDNDTPFLLLFNNERLMLIDHQHNIVDEQFIKNDNVDGIQPVNALAVKISGKISYFISNRSNYTSFLRDHNDNNLISNENAHPNKITNTPFANLYYHKNIDKSDNDNNNNTRSNIKIYQPKSNSVFNLINTQSSHSIAPLSKIALPFINSFIN